MTAFHRPSARFARVMLAGASAVGLALSLTTASATAETPTSSAASTSSKSMKAPKKSKGKAGFERLATYPVYMNVPADVDPADETVAEISGITKDGKTVVYTDAAGKRIGFVDISDPSNPEGAGTYDLSVDGDAEDEPTSVYVSGDYVLVVVNTSKSYTETSGRVDVVKISTRKKVASMDLGGQPDSIAVSEDGKYGIVAIENERDEELTPAGGEEGDLPQLPAGYVSVIDMDGEPSEWKVTEVPFTAEDGSALPMMTKAGIDTPTDPEPEYVAINGNNVAAVSLQENNGIVLVDLATKEITSAFSAGNAKIDGLDTEKDGLFDTTGSIDVPREPDAIAWIGNKHIATANEGDWKGGSRGWTIFDANGDVDWDAGNSFENLATKHGLHNEKRAGKKGSEPEGIAVAKYGKDTYAFVGSERSNFVAVYNVNKPLSPKYIQTLPTTNGPEGLLPVPQRDLFVVASEVDDAEERVRSTITVYGRAPMELDGWPSIVSKNDSSGMPIGWGALSGLTASPQIMGKLTAVSDSAYAEGRLYHIMAMPDKPAMITGVTVVKDENGPVEGLDLEGIYERPMGGYWLASEAKKPSDAALHRIDSDGMVLDTVKLPAEVTSKLGKWNLEGVTATGLDTTETVYFAIQRLKEDLTQTMIGAYHVKSEEFSWYSYPLETTTVEGDWIGISEITALGGDKFAVIERDKLNGPDAALKKVYMVDLGEKGGSADNPTKVEKEELLDVLPDLKAPRGWTQEKLEGLAMDVTGRMYAVTDNDAVDDATGETVFMDLGKVKDCIKPGHHPKPGKPDATDKPTMPSKPDATDEPTKPAKPTMSPMPTKPAKPGDDLTPVQIEKIAITIKFDALITFVNHGAKA